MLHSVHPDEEPQSQPQSPQQQPDEKKKKRGEREEEADLDGMADDQSEQSEPVELEARQHKLFNLLLASGKAVSFTLKFCPKEVKQYSFTIPLTLAKFGGLPSLTRQVHCRGLKPKFLIEPQALDFRKKVITTPDKCFPTVQEVTLSNPDRHEVRWRVDVTALRQDKIFDVEPNEGVVPAGSQERVRIKFNPYGPGLFT